MIFDILYPSLQISVSLSQILYQQVFHQTFSIFRKGRHELDSSLKDVLVDLHGLVVRKWVNAHDHLINQNS